MKKYFDPEMEVIVFDIVDRVSFGSGDNDIDVSSIDGNMAPPIFGDVDFD